MVITMMILALGVARVNRIVASGTACTVAYSDGITTYPIDIIFIGSGSECGVVNAEIANKCQ